ncbi:MAG: hypothetical protein IJO70_02225 [Lachnospiraceae bacterium]|nr:hypothetical protein [Lachnospiraceae bacterium]
MRKRLLLCIIMVILCLSGCDNKEGKEIDEKLSSLDSSESIVGEENNKDDEIYSMPESVSYELSSKLNSGKFIKVDAKVSATQTDDISVYSLSYTPMDDAYIKGYADKLFDNGEYSVVKPYEISSLEQLNEERNHYMDIWSYYGGVDGEGVKQHYGVYSSISIGPEHNITMIDQQVSEFQESNVVEYKENQILYEESYEDFDEAGNIAGEVIAKKGKLRGTVDGDEWELRAYGTNENNKHDYDVMIMHKIYTDTEVIQCIGVNDFATSCYGNNLLDIDTARADVEEFLKKLGFDKIDNISTFQLVTKMGDKEVNDGYRFIFAPRYDSLPLAFLNSSYVIDTPTYAKVYGIEQACFQEYIHVNITSEGILEVSFYKGYDEPVELTDDAELLSFEDVDIIAKKYIEESYPFVLTISNIELEYVITYYGEEDYALVPVWLYSTEIDVGGWDSSCFGINALDGSVIEFGYKEYVADVWSY